MVSTPAEQQLLIDFFHTGARLEYRKGEFIIGPDEDPRGVFYIESGIVKSYDITKYGEENLLIMRKSGEIIGLTWAITGEPKRILNAAIAPTVVWLVSRPKFLEFVRSHPEAVLPVLDTVTYMYKLHSDRILTLEYRTVRERLASFLLTTAHRFGQKVAAGTTILAPLKQQDIASSISATRETTSRALRQLQDQGIISYEQSIITITDEAELSALIS
jgi:CRP-like cAMP-binding protein